MARPSSSVFSSLEVKWVPFSFINTSVFPTYVAFLTTAVMTFLLPSIAIFTAWMGGLIVGDVRMSKERVLFSHSIWSHFAKNTPVQSELWIVGVGLLVTSTCHPLATLMLLSRFLSPICDIHPPRVWASACTPSVMCKPGRRTWGPSSVKQGTIVCFMMDIPYLLD